MSVRRGKNASYLARNIFLMYTLDSFFENCPKTPFAITTYAYVPLHDSFPLFLTGNARLHSK